MAGHVFLGRYQIVRLLGEGGMGQVYLARQLDQDRQVVVKVLHRHLIADAHNRRAFQREMELMAGFRHPHAVEFYEGSIDDPQGPCVVMEYVPGLALDYLLARHGRLPPDRVGRLLGPLCAVLQAAHARGIIHRDLKPANLVVIDPDSPDEKLKVLDFGLAQLTPQASAGVYIPLERLTASSSMLIVGSPSYVCPEQVRGEEMDHRGDLYSVGVILYELLTGRRPFEGVKVEDILSAHAHQPPPPFHWSVGSLPVRSAIEELVIACLAKDPADRPQSAWELAKRYEGALGVKIWNGAEPPPLPKRQPSEAVHVAGSHPEQPPDPRAVLFQLKAWMPQPMAALKLRGFLNGIGAEVVDSLPGTIRAKLKRPRPLPADFKPPTPGLWSRLGFGKKPEADPYDIIDLEIQMQTEAGERPNQLRITLSLHPLEGHDLVADDAWRAWCEQIHRDTSAYLMAQR
jgi:serine/threonine-protein kinase